MPRFFNTAGSSFFPWTGRVNVGADGRLLFDRILRDFTAFWREHADAFLGRQPYHEAAAQLVFMAWLQRVINGGGRDALTFSRST